MINQEAIFLNGAQQNAALKAQCRCRWSHFSLILIEQELRPSLKFSQLFFVFQILCLLFALSNNLLNLKNIINPKNKKLRGVVLGCGPC